MISFQLTLAGYDVEDEATDDLIKWVRAPSRAALDAFLTNNALVGIVEEIDVLPDGHADDFDGGLDVILDAAGGVVGVSPLGAPVDEWPQQILEAATERQKAENCPAEFTEQVAGLEQFLTELWTSSAHRVTVFAFDCARRRFSHRRDQLPASGWFVGWPDSSIRTPPLIWPPRTTSRRFASSRFGPTGGRAIRRIRRRQGPTPS